MAQEYTVKLWEPWVDRETDELVRDDFGNYKGTVHFEEDSRGLDATFKKQPEPGEKKYGDIVGYKTKAGKSRQKFQRADRQEGDSHVSNQSSPNGPKNNYVPRDDNAIRAQWAIGQGVQVVHGTDQAGNWSAIEKYAKQLYAMVDRVKDSNTVPESVEDAVAEAQARRDADIIASQKTGVPVPDAVVTDFGDEPINLDEIPF